MRRCFFRPSGYRNLRRQTKKQSETRHTPPPGRQVSTAVLHGHIIIVAGDDGKDPETVLAQPQLHAVPLHDTIAGHTGAERHSVDTELRNGKVGIDRHGLYLIASAPLPYRSYVNEGVLPVPIGLVKPIGIRTHLAGRTSRVRSRSPPGDRPAAVRTEPWSNISPTNTPHESPFVRQRADMHFMHIGLPILRLGAIRSRGRAVQVSGQICPAMPPTR